MQMMSEGLELIKRFEGFRAAAYRDSAGVWTIGYGHTSMAGEPAVRPGMRLSRAEAAAILTRDVESFAQGVRQAVTIELSDAQFSALVSFAYNVGLANFRSSSVLKAVNASDFDQVPRRLSLWVKAGGRVLPGLVKRRTAEAELFASAAAAGMPQLPGEPVTQVKGKPPHLSTTNWAAVASALAGIMTSIAAAFRDIADAMGGPALALGAIAIIVLASLWIIRERHRKSAEEGV
jgi:lysozyme